MIEGQLPGVQGKVAKVGAAAPVDFIAHYRKTEGFQVYANLVGATGLRVQRHETVLECRAKNLVART